jgi:hypothetical protein
MLLATMLTPAVVFGTVEPTTRTVTPLTEHDVQIDLTAKISEAEQSESHDVYAVFVIDATSSMGAADIPETDDNASALISRKSTETEAIKAYIDAFFAADMGAGITRHVALVSFGNSARVHTPSEPTSYIGMTKTEGSVADYQTAVELYNSFTSRYSASNEGTDSFFSSDPDVIKTMVDNVPNFSNTNAESGIAMADFLVTNLTNDSDAVYSFVVTDGEQAASSTLSMIMNNPALEAALINDAELATYTNASGTPYLSAEKVFRNVVRLANDEGFANSLKPVAVNFFAGSWHNLDSGTYTNKEGRVKGYNDLMGLLNSSLKIQAPFTDAASFFDALAAVDTQLAAELDAAVEAGTDPADYTSYRTALVSYAEYALLMAEQRAPFYHSSNSIELLTRALPNAYESADGLTPTVSNVPLSLSELFPAGKTSFLEQRDYREGSSENVTGSTAAKDLMAQAAANLQQHSYVYAVGIGSQLVMPEKLSPVASEPVAFLECKVGNDAYGTAEKLRTAFAHYGFSNQFSAEELILTDSFKTRGADDFVADDDTFTLKEDSIQIHVYFYDAEGNQVKSALDPSSEQEAGRLIIEDTNPADDGEIYARTHISWQAGFFYPEAFAREMTGQSYPYKAEMLYVLTVNEVDTSEGVLGNQNNGPADDPIDESTNGPADDPNDNPDVASTDGLEGDQEGLTSSVQPPLTPVSVAPVAAPSATLIPVAAPPTFTAVEPSADTADAGEAEEAEAIGDNAAPAGAIDDSATPRGMNAGSNAAWALLNLICVIIGLLWSVIFLVRFLHKFNKRDAKYENERLNMAEGALAYKSCEGALESDALAQANPDEEETVTHRKRFIAHIVVAFISVVAFIVFTLTEDITLPMAWVDRWTVLMVAFLIGQALVSLYAARLKDVNDEDAEDESETPLPGSVLNQAS